MQHLFWNCTQVLYAFTNFLFFYIFWNINVLGFCSRPLSVYFPQSFEIVPSKVGLWKVYNQYEPSVKGQLFPKLSSRQNPFNFNLPNHEFDIIILQSIAVFSIKNMSFRVRRAWGQNCLVPYITEYHKHSFV